MSFDNGNELFFLVTRISLTICLTRVICGPEFLQGHKNLFIFLSCHSKRLPDPAVFPAGFSVVDNSNDNVLTMVTSLSCQNNLIDVSNLLELH